MTSVPNSQNTRMENLIMAAEMQSNKAPLPAHTMPFYFCDQSAAQIPTPKNKSELELYKLLERANLIDYFPTFLKYGGDDVVQLAEANEEEFLEIVELIGMHHKPLHVRRLQKALAQWRDDKIDALALQNDKKFRIYYDSAGHYFDHATAAAQRGDRTRYTSSLLDESVGRTSSASRSLFPVNNDDLQSLSAESSQLQQQQYLAPHEIIKNAPKRPRLMDSIKPSDLTKGIQMYDSSSVHSTPVRPTYSRGRGLKLPPSQPGESRPTTPNDTRHPIQISPPDSEESESDECSSRAKSNRNRARRKAIPAKAK